MQKMKIIAERFWDKVDKSGGENACWNWTAAKLPHGYGKLQSMLSHRASWKIHFGEIPSGLLVCHKCDNPSCVNPNHLFLGTHKQNTQDMVKKGRAACGDRHGSKTHKENVRRGDNHPFTKIKQSDIPAVLLMRKNGMYFKDIALKYGVSWSAIQRICKINQSIVPKDYYAPLP